jgi:hypothetical protein
MWGRNRVNPALADARGVFLRNNRNDLVAAEPCLRSTGPDLQLTLGVLLLTLVLK